MLINIIIGHLCIIFIPFGNECGQGGGIKGRGDILKNSADRKKLITHPATNVAKHGLVKAKIASAMEYVAYNEQAKHILERIKQQLNQTTGCTFSPQFCPDLDELTNKIDHTVTIKNCRK
ncbi:hypothetical protein [Sulfuriflexus mobilis]|uniref:hypothetical protein n=1 Tax=Sulfuriflexus mobilis TaxID=1811807 RepID=UPI000F82042F|nr:hypothetical protein [Sulfuriflexus mobilis]